MRKADDIAREILAAWNARDLHQMVSLMSEDVTWYDPAMPSPPAKGREAVSAFSISVLEAFPDFTFEIREPICVSADGKRCVLPWRITATASGWMRPPGFAPTGRRLTFEGVDVIDTDGELVTKIETYFDAIAATEKALAITLRPKAGSFREKLMVGAQRSRAAWLRRHTESL